MKIPGSSRRQALQFNITPLIDIVFLLIIFFLVASHFVRSENLEAVELPNALTAAKDLDAVPNRLTITVLADDSLIVGGNPIMPDDLPTLLITLTEDELKRIPEVRIRADKTVKWKTIEPIMLRCAELGISNVKTAVMGSD